MSKLGIMLWNSFCNFEAMYVENPTSYRDIMFGTAIEVHMWEWSIFKLEMRSILAEIQSAVAHKR